MQTVTLLGTGLMGYPMARNIAKASFDLTVWNRSAAKAAPLADDGIAVAGDAGFGQCSGGMVRLTFT